MSVATTPAVLLITVLVTYLEPCASNQLVNEFGQNVQIFKSQQTQLHPQQQQFQSQQQQFQPQQQQFQPQQQQFHPKKEQFHPQLKQFHPQQQQLLAQQKQFQPQQEKASPQQEQFHAQEQFIHQGEQTRTKAQTPTSNHKPREEDSEECISGFSVRKSLRTTLKAKTQIKFQDVLTNAGGWDSNNNAFIAPCSGIYFFTFNAVSEEKQGFTLALMKNDKYQVTAYGGKEGYQWGSNSAMLFLNPDDIVFLQLQDGEIYEHPFNEAYTTFTGFLVNKF